MKFKISNNIYSLLEMARVGYIDNLEIYIRTDDAGMIPHFHICDTATKGQYFHTCVKLNKPEYFHHTGKTDVLNTKQRKELVKFLTTKTDRGLTNWEVILDLWNMNNSKVTVPYDLKMPNYADLKGDK